VLIAALGIAVAEIEHFGRLSRVHRNLQYSSAQIRVRGALLFLIGFAVLAQPVGLEIILGAFIAGTVLRLRRPALGRSVPARRPHPPARWQETFRGVVRNPVERLWSEARIACCNGFPLKRE
jgi:uncharacterized iron-regulated membrane protein